uniref:Uncharacterized protein n=1 Tax=Siphoviridae sp. ctkhg5 TaxID=2825643 RepID=A0A8S5UDB7_9CAUD|nr:MAG TPA: hypothetical protein [Siphoviridae sp. ctkhg5]
MPATGFEPMTPALREVPKVRHSGIYATKRIMENG